MSIYIYMLVISLGTVSGSMGVCHIFTALEVWVLGIHSILFTLTTTTYACTADIKLLSAEGCNLPERKNSSVSDSCHWTQPAEHVTEKHHPNFRSVALTVVSTERVILNGRINRSNPETAAKVYQSSPDVPPRVEAAGINKRRPTDVLSTNDCQFLEVELYDAQSDRVDRSKFQSLNKAACAMMCAGLMCFSFSFMCCELPLPCTNGNSHSKMC